MALTKPRASLQGHCGGLNSPTLRWPPMSFVGPMLLFSSLGRRLPAPFPSSQLHLPSLHPKGKPLKEDSPPPLHGIAQEALSPLPDSLQILSHNGPCLPRAGMPDQGSMRGDFKKKKERKVFPFTEKLSTQYSAAASSCIAIWLLLATRQSYFSRPRYNHHNQYRVFIPLLGFKELEVLSHP